MKRLFTVAACLALTACGGAGDPSAARPLPALYQEGRCFRASEITNYNVEAPHAAFVLTSRGYVYGLVSENCFRDDGQTFSVIRPNLNDGWICGGDVVTLHVREWRGRGHPCLAHLTQPIDDPALSGFRARARPPA